MRMILVRRCIVTLAALAWLLGAAWHGSMGVRTAIAATGIEVCTSHGVKRVPGGGEPASPAKSAPAQCQLCAAFSAPGATAGYVPFEPQSVTSESVLWHPVSAAVRATHLADLASRAPPAR